MLSQNTTKPKTSKLLRVYFKIISNNDLDDRIRARKIARLRRKMDIKSDATFMKAVRKEMNRKNNSYVYSLFLQNIVFSGRL